MSPDELGLYGSDIYTEPDADPDALAHLGPLRGLAGIWEGTGVDIHPVGPGSDIDGPVVDGGLENAYVERYELQPIDPQTNGPQLFYGLRYHVHIVKPGEVETFHDQVGYWLWEPAANTVTQTIAIPRGRSSSPPVRPPPTRRRSRSAPPWARRSTASCRTRSSPPRTGRSASGSR